MEILVPSPSTTDILLNYTTFKEKRVCKIKKGSSLFRHTVSKNSCNCGPLKKTKSKLGVCGFKPTGDFRV